MKFTEVNEGTRIYHYPDGSSFAIPGVYSINVSKSGTHRINARNPDGSIGTMKYIVAPGWRYIAFTADEWTF